MVSGRRGAALAAAGAAFAMAASCRVPTTVEVRAETNLAYRSGLVVSFTVGTPDDIEGADPTTETAGPWGNDGFVGSLVVVPRAADDARLGVKVILGVHHDARECRPPAYEGCIVARRSLRFTPHTRLQLPVSLFAECENVPCDAVTTCARGKCVAAEVDPGTCASEHGCSVPGAPDVVPGTPPVSPDGSIDGSVLPDASSPDDAATDAPGDAPVDPPADASGVDAGRSIDCGNGLVCNAPSYCCWSDTNQVGACVTAPQPCPYRSIGCDRRSQCAAMCCLDTSTAGGTTCGALGCSGGTEICHGNGASPLCYIGQCTGLAYGHYRSCQ